MAENSLNILSFVKKKYKLLQIIQDKVSKMRFWLRKNDRLTGMTRISEILDNYPQTLLVKV